MCMALCTIWHSLFLINLNAVFNGIDFDQLIYFCAICRLVEDNLTENCKFLVAEQSEDISEVSLFSSFH